MTPDIQSVSIQYNHLKWNKAFLPQKLEQDFVEMRKTDAHMNADLFHFMLDMARWAKFCMLIKMYVMETNVCHYNIFTQVAIP